MVVFVDVIVIAHVIVIVLLLLLETRERDHLPDLEERD